MSNRRFKKKTNAVSLVALVLTFMLLKSNTIEPVFAIAKPDLMLVDSTNLLEEVDNKNGLETDKGASLSKTSSGQEILLEGKIKLDFTKYLSFLEKQGGKLVVFDIDKQLLVSGVNSRGNLIAVEFSDQYSSKTRDVTSEIPSNDRLKILNELIKMHGQSAYLFLILMPNELERKLTNSVLEVVKNQLPARPDLVRFQYESAGGVLNIRILEAKIGSESFNLNSVVRFL